MASTSIDLLAKELCKQTGNPDYRNYFDIIGHLRRGFQDLNLHALPIIKTVELEIDSLDSVEWPADCIRPLALGVARNGRIVTLSRDESIVAKDHEDVAYSITEADEIINQLAFGFLETGHQLSFLGELFGLGQGFNNLGYVAHDYGRRLSHIKGTMQEGDYILFMYKATGIAEGIEFIPSEAEKALRHYVMMEYYQVRNPGLSREQERRWKEELYRLGNLYTEATEDEWIDAMTSNYKSSVKN